VNQNFKTLLVFVTGLIAGVVFFGGSSNDGIPSTSPGDSDLDSRVSQTIEMKAAGQSPPLRLSGNYEVSWETLTQDCKTSSVLWATDEVVNFGTAFGAEGISSGKSYFYDLEDRNYYLDTSDIWTNTCHWKATFTPIALQ
jgi:hypothetical protein